MSTAAYRTGHPGNPADELFRRSYGASISVLRSVVPFLGGRDDAASRLSKNVKAVPRLIAAALHGSVPPLRRTHALAEAGLLCREAVVMLSYCRDLHARFINSQLCAELIETYRLVDAELSQHLEGGCAKAEAAA